MLRKPSRPVFHRRGMKWPPTPWTRCAGIKSRRDRGQSGWPPESVPGYIDGMRQFLRETREAVDMRKHIDHWKTNLSRMIDDTVSLIVVFVLQTILLPSSARWLMAWLCRSPPRLALSPSPAGATAFGTDTPKPLSAFEEGPKPLEINSQSLYKPNR